MKAGQLDRLIDLLRRRTDETDSLGQPPRDFDVFATVWASVEPVTAKEMRSAQQTVNTMDIVVRIRWMHVLPIDRVRFEDGREAGVVSVVNPKLSGDMIELHCLYVAEQIHSGDGI